MSDEKAKNCFWRREIERRRDDGWTGGRTVFVKKMNDGDKWDGRRGRSWRTGGEIKQGVSDLRYLGP